jgi:hypothetical protein
MTLQCQGAHGSRIAKLMLKRFTAPLRSTASRRTLGHRKTWAHLITGPSLMHLDHAQQALSKAARA